MNEIEKIWLSRIKISNRVKRNLIEKFGSIKSFYNCSLDDLVYFNVCDKYIKEILDLNLRKRIFYEYEYLKQNSIGILSFEDEEYPIKLKQIDDFPLILFYKGDINILSNDGVGIVGSRFALNWSLRKSKEIAKEFSKIGINVISGLARGVDKYAHLGCIDNIQEEKIGAGKTVAVLGSGIDKLNFYPQENYRVFEKIIDSGGCVLTEYPINTKPVSYNFPYRNRIISGLSEKLIIIQAGQKSGSLITVEYALEQGKDIYVIKPDLSLDLYYFKGNIELIKQGAKIYENTEKLILN